MIPAAFGYNAVLSLFTAAQGCKDKSASCIVNNIDSVKDIDTSFNSVSFKNRSLQVGLAFFQIKNGEVEDLNLG